MTNLIYRIDHSSINGVIQHVLNKHTINFEHIDLKIRATYPDVMEILNEPGDAEMPKQNPLERQMIQEQAQGIGRLSFRVSRGLDSRNTVAAFTERSMAEDFARDAARRMRDYAAGTTCVHTVWDMKGHPPSGTGEAVYGHTGAIETCGGAPRGVN